MPLTLQELSEKYNISPSSITSNFTRTKEAIAKKFGVRVEKIGRGKNAIYEIADFEHTDPNRAPTLFESTEKNMIPAQTAAKLPNLHCLAFIGIVLAPQRVFRGSYADLLKYLEIPVTPDNIEKAREAIKEMDNRNFIMSMEDKTDNNYFMAGILRQVEKENSLNLQVLLDIKKLLENSKKDFIPFFKFYLAALSLPKDTPCTLQELQDATGMSEYKIRDCLKFFEAANGILREKKYYVDKASNTIACLGQVIDVNAFGLTIKKEDEQNTPS